MNLSILGTHGFFLGTDGNRNHRFYFILDLINKSALWRCHRPLAPRPDLSRAAVAPAASLTSSLFGCRCMVPVLRWSDAASVQTAVNLSRSVERERVLRSTGGAACVVVVVVVGIVWSTSNNPAISTASSSRILWSISSSYFPLSTMSAVLVSLRSNVHSQAKHTVHHSHEISTFQQGLERITR